MAIYLDRDGTGCTKWALLIITILFLNSCYQFEDNQKIIPVIPGDPNQNVPSYYYKAAPTIPESHSESFINPYRVIQGYDHDKDYVEPYLKRDNFRKNDNLWQENEREPEHDLIYE